MTKEKQIEEMAVDMYVALPDDEHNLRDCRNAATEMIAKGWHKQSEGEWIVSHKHGLWYYDCPFCDDGYAQEGKLPVSNYCANCGARLKGGESDA